MVRWSFSMIISRVLTSGELLLNKITRAQLWIHLNISSYSFWRKNTKEKEMICAPPNITWTWVQSQRDSCKARNISQYDSIFSPSLFLFLLFSDSISLSDVLPACHSGAEDEDCQREQSVLIKDMSDPQPQEIHPEGNTEITSSTTATGTEKCVST